MARKRASMREGPLAELFRATEAAQRGEGDDQSADDPLPPAASAEEQQTLILEPAAAAPQAAPVQSRREEAALEETVEHVHDLVEQEPVPAEQLRRQAAAFEETVEHVHDFEAVPEEPVVAPAAPVALTRPSCPCRRPSRLHLWPLLRPRRCGRIRPTSRPPAASSSRCPRGRRA